MRVVGSIVMLVLANLPLPVQAYECFKGDIFLALDASESVKLSSVQDEAREVFQAIDALKGGGTSHDLRVIEAVAFTDAVKHSSKNWRGTDSTARAKALVEAFAQLSIEQRGTALVPVLQYARAAFQNRSEDDRSRRKAILVIITDGQAETAMLEGYHQMRDDLRRGDGFKPMAIPETEGEASVRRELESRQRAYVREVNALYGAGIDSIGIAPGWQYHEKTLGELTSDRVEELDTLEEQLKELVKCIV